VELCRSTRLLATQTHFPLCLWKMHTLTTLSW
jgi:hypothetical protein